MAKGTKYSQKFKEDAVRYRLEHPEITMRKCADILGISQSALKTWMKAAKELNPSLHRVVYSSLSTLTANDFYRNLVRELGAEPAYKKPDNFRIIQEEIKK